MDLLLVITHLVAFFLGGLMVRLVMFRYLGVTEADKDHVNIEFRHHHYPHTPGKTMRTRRRVNWIAATILVFSVFVIAIGVQAYAQNQADNSLRKRDAELTKCVRDFSTQLAETYAERSTASQMLEQAQNAKAEAQDHVFLAVIQLRAVPPRATPEDFDAALQVFRSARQDLNRVSRQVSKVRQENPLPDPDGVCR